MPIPSQYLADFNEHGIYHVYNRTNNQERLFLCDGDKMNFLAKYDTFLSPFLDTFCWSLLPNHFHLIVRVKTIAVIEANLGGLPPKLLVETEKKFLRKEIGISELIEQSFKRFFQSYSISFNNLYNRKGNLFYKPFKRVEITGDAQFTRTMVYVHANAQKHGLVKDFTDWHWTSWHILLSGVPTRLLRSEVMDWFGGKDLFIKTHREMVEYYYTNDLSIEE